MTDGIERIGRGGQHLFVAKPATPAELALYAECDAVRPKLCHRCGEAKPRTLAHWTRATRNRPDHLTTECNACWRGRRTAIKARQQAERAAARAGRLPPTPLERALAPLGAQLPPLPPSYDFRQVLLGEVKKEWPALARQVVQLAKGGNPQMLRQVLQFVFEGQDDDSALQFWQIVMAGAAQSRAAGAAPPWGVPPTDPLRQAIWARIGYHPTADQWTAHERRDPAGAICRQIAIAGGFQSGKTTWAAAEAVSYLPWLAGREIWLMGPDYEQSRREMELLRDWTQRLGLWSGKPQHVSMPLADALPWRFVLRNGTLVRNYTASQFRKAAGTTPGLILLCEPGQIPDGDAFMLMLLRAGLDAVPLYLIGTQEGENWYAELIDRWQSGQVPGKTAYELPTWGNTHLFPGGRTDEKIRLIENDPDVSRERFLERYAGKRVAPPGLVFGPTAHHPGFVAVAGAPETHVRPIRREWPPEPANGPKIPEMGVNGAAERPNGATIPEMPETGAKSPKSADSTVYIGPEAPLELWIDWGYDHPYAVLLVSVTGDPKSVYVLDELVVSGINTPAMIALAQARWAAEWPRLVRFVLDPATRQHHDGPKTTREYWASPAFVGRRVPTWAETRVPVREATDRIRRLLEVHPFLGRPRLLVDPRCRHLIREFTREYRNRLDTRGTSTGIPIPLHDDAIKCLHYGTYVAFPGMSVDRPRSEQPYREFALPFR